uniref:Si:dkey-260c8.8 n=1 Tax=Sphaeramia orbicularis TaxID=375764 RepID=A0A673AEA8_9TELE
MSLLLFAPLSLCAFSQDLLGTDWAVRSSSGPADVAAAVSSCTLRASSVAQREPEKNRLQQTGERSAVLCSGTASRSSTHTSAGQTLALGLRQLPSSFSSSSVPHPPTLNNAQPDLAPQQTNTAGTSKPSAAQDDFDDWDIDLADLEEVDRQMGQPDRPPASFPPVPTPVSAARALRPTNRGAPHTLPNNQPSAPHSPGVFPGFTAASPKPSSFSRKSTGPQHPQKHFSTPGPSKQSCGLFETLSPAASSHASPPALSPLPLRAPVLTNRLVQLVSASSKLPQKRPRSEGHRPRTRRFPGPAGLLPQQVSGQSLDDIVVPVPQTPAHGVMARFSQSDEDDFSGGAWAAMKAEMGLDERNPSCFLSSYSVVMVLRKAALKQLVKNKVPNMAVLLKSIIHTHTDAKAVFKDPTGEIQGTVHRRLLEDRVGELKVGAVLLLKQVGVFSPSHRNHYLNVTPNNLLRIYSPDGVGLTSSSQLPPLEPVSQMQLVFDEDNDEGNAEGHKLPQSPAAAAVRNAQESAEKSAPQDSGWDAGGDALLKRQLF